MLGRLERDGIAGRDLIDAAARHLAEIRSMPEGHFYQGRCHGDLTFANMVFRDHGGEILLLDFLDPYIEAPILDFVKLLQETRLRWASLTSSRSHDVAKYQIAMRLLEQELLTTVGDQFPAAQVRVMEFQNIIRVLPNVGPGPVRSALEGRALAMMETTQ